MEPYEILAEIRKDCPVKPLPYLLNHPNSIESLRDYCGESNNKARCWDLIDLTDNLLLCKLSIGLFVAAKDGKPLEVPYHYDRFEQYGLSMPFNTSESQICFEYQKAQKEVIFEGWKVQAFLCGDTFLHHDNYTLRYSTAKDLFELFVLTDSKRLSFGMIKSIANLAEATQSNPLKLK